MGGGDAVVGFGAGAEVQSGPENREHRLRNLERNGSNRQIRKNWRRKEKNKRERFVLTELQRKPEFKSLISQI